MRILVICLALLVLTCAQDNDSGSQDNGDTQPAAGGSTVAPPAGGAVDNSTTPGGDTPDVGPVCQPVTTPATDRPTLQGVFHTYATVLKQNTYQYDLELYFDFPGQRATVRKQAIGGAVERHMFSFAADNPYKLTITDTCSKAELADTGFSFWDITIDTSGASEAYTAASLFYFGDFVSEELVESDVLMRGFSTKHYTSCLTTSDDPAVTIQLDYYFKDNTPVRAVMLKKVPSADDPTVMTTEETIVDFHSFHLGQPCDDDVYEIPRGVVCDIGDKSVPSLADRFSINTEYTFPGEHFTFLVKEKHNVDIKLSRYDWNPHADHSSIYGTHYDFQPITVIHDFNEHATLEYVLTDATCVVAPIDPNVMEGNWNDVISNTVDEATTLLMRRGNQYFSIDNAALKYQGVKKIRGMDTYAFARSSGNTQIEYYFVTEACTMMSSRGQMTSPLAAIWMRKTNADTSETSAVTESWSHFFNYINSTADVTSYAAFDISLCTQEERHFVIQVEGNYEDLVRGTKKSYLIPEVQKTMAYKAAVSPLRITNIDFFNFEEGKTDIWMSLLGSPSVTGLTDLETAFTNLKTAVDSEAGVTFTVTYEGQTEAEIIHVASGSLQTSYSSPDPRPNTNTVTQVGHSNGSMAALGIFMVLFGTVIGVAVGFMLWRRRGRGIPYSVQH